MKQVRQNLLTAERKAKELFIEVEQNGLIVPGKKESVLCQEIVSLASKIFKIENYWHKKIVRAGQNTLHPFNANPGDRVIEEDDIVFLDFGLIVNGWEADLGRTFVVGNNPLKLKLKKDVEIAWHEANSWYLAQHAITGAQFFAYLTKLATKFGWQFGGEIGGHIVGRYPHEQPDDPADMCLDILPTITAAYYYPISREIKGIGYWKYNLLTG